VLVLGAGPVGLLAARSAWLFGAGRVIVLDHIDYRLEFARSYCPAEVYNFKELDDVVVFMKKTTDGLASMSRSTRSAAMPRATFLQTLFGTKLKLEAATPSRPWAINSGQERRRRAPSSASTGRQGTWSRSAIS
jgi:threonine dehydrogenase-like Zn-dependent dehydrogenase